MTCARSQVVDLFGATKVPYGDKFVRGITATCGYCPTVESLPVNNFATKHTDEQSELNFIKRKLEGRGWKIGNRPDQHRCPKCFIAIKVTASRRAGENRVARANGETPMSVTPIKTLKEAGARMMGREDRRIIFAKLNEVYVGDKVGYGDGWTDEKVAGDLGVPRAWVKLIRDENFGDEVANDEIRRAVTDAGKLLEQITATAARAEVVAVDLKRLNSEADRIGRSLDVIRKALGVG
jgi:hypothetical protein